MQKRLKLDTLLEADPASAMFVEMSSAGPRSLDANDWARAFLTVELGRTVPDEVRRLFNVAVACLCYGWFFYPLFVLGEEQALRVAETAARMRAALAGPQPRRFAAVIEQLNQAGVIGPADRPQWEAIRRMRNASSHPDDQSLMPPGAVLNTVSTIARQITLLFDADLDEAVELKGPD